MSKPGNRVLNFMGLGRKPAAEASGEAEEGAAGTKAKSDDDDEEDDDEKCETDTPEEKAAKESRNRLRAAGERRGRAAERQRIGAIVSGVDPAKAEFALSFALDTDLTPDQAKAMIAKSPKGSRAPFVDAMAQHGGGAPPAGGHKPPGFGAEQPGKGGTATLSAGMTKLLKLRGLTAN